MNLNAIELLEVPWAGNNIFFKCFTHSLTCPYYKRQIKPTTCVMYEWVIWLACGQENFPLNILGIFPIPLPTNRGSSKTINVVALANLLYV
jgi:hypothetical protein